MLHSKHSRKQIKKTVFSVRISKAKGGDQRGASQTHLGQQRRSASRRCDEITPATQSLLQRDEEDQIRTERSEERERYLI
jgi:hypothetical protein